MTKQQSVLFPIRVEKYLSKQQSSLRIQEIIILALKPRAIIRIQSEIAQLEQVIVHTPGPEMTMVSPENRLDLLFDDILFEDVANEEHAAMCSVFKKVAGDHSVIQIGDLFRELLDDEAVRAFYLESLITESPELNIVAWKSQLLKLTPEAFFDFVLTGRSELDLHMLSIPNLMFTRDLASVVDDHIILSRPSKSVRIRESLILKTVLFHHPSFEAFRDKIIELPSHANFEGGDLLVANSDSVFIGHSERTSFAGVKTIAQALFDKTEVQRVFMIDIPKKRSCMHLDTVMTFASKDECVVFPPIIQDALDNVTVFSAGDKNTTTAKTLSSVQSALNEAMGHDVALIPCGGPDPLNQKREQWTDGSNLFTVAPGVVVGYARNENTFAALKDVGYRIVSSQGFLSFYEDSAFEADEKMAIKLEGNELSRGRGGPRCMTLPISRKVL